jgi:hypothetical protein
MAQYYIPVPDSFNSILGKRLMELNTKEIFSIGMDGQVMKIVPVVKDGLLSSPDKKIDMNKYIESNSRDIEIITQLERRGVRHVSKPTTPDELEYKRARNRINRRKAYLKERAEQLNISLPSNNDIKHGVQLINTQNNCSEVQMIPQQIEFQQQSFEMEAQEKFIIQSSQLNVEFSNNKMDEVNNSSNCPNENKSITHWWNQHFGSNYVKLRKGYLGRIKEKVPMLGECEIEYFIPNEDIEPNISIQYNEFQNKLNSYHRLARNLNINDRLDHVDSTHLENMNINKNGLIIEILETSPFIIDNSQIQRILSTGRIINPNETICN